ncbi:MAG: hypothetical protein KY396_05530 [Actinobacteria bacterium]|nr:hypothetical protein [Actinomycetota bacterium]
MARMKELGRAGASAGWRKAVADRVASAVSTRTRFDRDDVRAALGAVFVAASVVYVARTLRELQRRTA